MNVHILPTTHDKNDARQVETEDATIACEFCYNGGKMKISGPGTITFSAQGIYLQGHRPASSLRRVAVRVSLLFGGLMLVVVPVAVYQAWLGMESEGFHWSSYAIAVFLAAGGFPTLSKLSRRLEGGDENALPEEGFIPAGELISVEQQPLLGTMLISYRAAGSWLPGSVQIISETSLDELKARIEVIKNGAALR